MQYMVVRWLGSHSVQGGTALGARGFQAHLRISLCFAASSSLLIASHLIVIATRRKSPELLEPLDRTSLSTLTKILLSLSQISFHCGGTVQA